MLKPDHLIQGPFIPTMNYLFSMFLQNHFSFIELIYTKSTFLHFVYTNYLLNFLSPLHFAFTFFVVLIFLHLFLLVTAIIYHFTLLVLISITDFTEINRLMKMLKLSVALREIELFQQELRHSLLKENL